MSDLDLSKLTNDQLVALHGVGGDLTKLPDDVLSGIHSSQTPVSDPSVLDSINKGVNWLGTQLTKGVTATLGTPTSLGEAAQHGAEWLGEKAGLPEAGRAAGATLRNQLTFGGMTPRTEDMNNFIFGHLAPEVNMPSMPMQVGDKTIDAGKIIDAGVQAIPGMAAGGVSSLGAPLARAATAAIPAFTGGAGSELLGQATADTPYEMFGRLGGGTLGYLLGGRAVTPLPANLTQNGQRAVEIARNLKAPLSVSQETGRLQGLETGLARFPLTSGPFRSLTKAQNEQAIGKAAEEAGSRPGYTSVAPEKMDEIRRTASLNFEDAKSNGPPVSLDNEFFNDITGTQKRYNSLQAPSDRAPVIGEKVADYPSVLQRLQSLLTTGEPPKLTSAQYQEYRKGVNDLIGPDTRPAVNTALKGIVNALDDAMERSGTPEQAEAWAKARRQYANFKILQKAAAYSTAEGRKEGTLSPNALSTVLRRRQGDAFANTTGGMNDIARLQNYTANYFPNSGTPTMMAVHKIFEHVPAALGAVMLGGHEAGMINPALALPTAAAAGGLYGLSKALAGRGPISSQARAYLSNQAMPGFGTQAANAPLSLAPSIPQLIEDQRERRRQ